MRLVLLALALCASLPAMAQDQLFAPQQRSPVSEQYRANVKLVLREAYEADVRVKAIVLPSFAPEMAIGVRERGGVFTIFGLEAKGPIWNYSLAELMRTGRIQMMSMDGTQPDMRAQARRVLKGMPKNPADLQVTRCSAPIEPALATHIIGAWRVMLAAVRPEDRPQLGNDGVSYSFTMASDGREWAGDTWSPRPATRPGQLVKLSEAMRAYCLKPGPETLGPLTTLAAGFPGQ